jgi:hypothetical protein
MMTGLLKIAENVKDYPFRQKARLQMARNDFMIEEENNKFYQVEYNLIASGMGPICEEAHKVHKILNDMTGQPS